MFIASPIYVAFLGFALAGNAVSEEAKLRVKRRTVMFLGAIGLLVCGVELFIFIKNLWGF